MKRISNYQQDLIDKLYIYAISNQNKKCTLNLYDKKTNQYGEKNFM